MDPDVLIVGAGPSGAIAAKRLAEEGFKVLVLEQGDWPDYSKAQVTRDDFPLTAGRDWGWDPNVRRAPGDYPIDDSDSDITALMWNGVGGGTVVYAAQWQRNMPSDFRVRTLDGVADDWPLTYEDLEPYYVRVERDFGISGLAGDTAFPPGEGPPLPPVPLGPAGRRVARAHNELGWHWWPAPLAIATRKYGALNPCLQRGTCLQACQEGAKGTADLTHWPRALELGVELRTRARVQRADGAARRAGRAAPSTSTPTASSTRSAPASRSCARTASARRGCCCCPDLANSSGLVGKRLMMHPFGTVVGVFDEDFRAWQGPWGQFIHSLEFYETDAVARIRARRQVGPAADRRAVLDDQRVSVGRRERDLGRGLPGRGARAARPLDDVGHHRRGPARGVQPGRARPGRAPTSRACRARRSSTGCRRTRAGWSSSTRRGRRSR